MLFSIKMVTEVFQSALILTGPTGSGKSSLSLELAERMNAEILSMDSMALYRGMSILSAKPDAEAQQRVPHHLLDVLDPWESSSVAWWLEQAEKVCIDILNRGRRPLFVGGTALYLKALLHGLFDGPPADESLRAELEHRAESHGVESLHQQLAAVDPESARRLHPNDVRRVIRALEVHTLTGKPISQWQQQWRQSEPKDDNPRCFCIDRPRAELYQRIDARVHEMIAAGLLDEVRALPQSISREAAQAVGFSEMQSHIAGDLTLEEAIERMQQRSRQYAKRQLTWFRNLPECQMIPANSAAIAGLG